MESSLQVFTNNEFTVRTTRDANGTVWFVGKDIAQALEYSESSLESLHKLFAPVPDVWKGRKRFPTVERGMQEMLCLTEQGIYFFLGRSDKPKALPYQMWIAGDVVPSIMHTGSYRVHTSDDELQRRDRELDSKNREIDLERAKILQRMIDAPAVPLSEESKAVIQHEIFSIISGHECVSMLPQVHERYYSATELGEMFGVSNKQIGKIAKAHGLKPEEGEPSEYGIWVLTKSRYSCHQCSTFKYNDKAVHWFTEHQELLRKEV